MHARELFILITFFVFFLSDFYTYRAFVAASCYVRTYRKLFNRVFFGFSALVLLTGIALTIVPYYNWNKAFVTYWMSSIIVIYFAKFAIILFLLVDDIHRVIVLLRKKRSKPSPQNLSKIPRSVFLNRMAIITAGIPVFLSFRGMLFSVFNFQVKKQTLSFKNLPQNFSGLKIIQISDVHLGSFFDVEPIERAVKMINELKADLLVFTGDLVNVQTDEALPEYIAALSKIKTKFGVYSVLGNHDYGDYRQWENKEAKEKNLLEMIKVHKKLGWKLLKDEHELLKIGKESIALIGVQNWSANPRFHSYGDLSKAVKNIPNDVNFRILLSHDPTHWDVEVTKDFPEIDLTLSGHTHGMQFGVDLSWIKWSPAKYLYRRWMGLYKSGNQHLYVNPGFGYIGFPARIGILPEITLFTLQNN